VERNTARLNPIKSISKSREPAEYFCAAQGIPRFWALSVEQMPDTRTSLEVSKDLAKMEWDSSLSIWATGISRFRSSGPG